MLDRAIEAGGEGPPGFPPAEAPRGGKPPFMAMLFEPLDMGGEMSWPRLLGFVEYGSCSLFWYFDIPDQSPPPMDSGDIGPFLWPFIVFVVEEYASCACATPTTPLAVDNLQPFLSLHLQSLSNFSRIVESSLFEGAINWLKRGTPVEGVEATVVSFRHLRLAVLIRGGFLFVSVGLGKDRDTAKLHRGSLSR